MKVHTIMSEPVTTCTPEMTLSAAAGLMRDADYGTLPVVDARGQLAGILTDRDICLAIAGGPRNAAQIAVREVMARQPIACVTTDSIDAALLTMRRARVRRLPVLDTFGRLRGLLSIDDIVVRGLDARAIDADDIIMALRTMYERRPALSAVEK